jgi:DNA-binding transcriptional MerR regulator
LEQICLYRKTGLPVESIKGILDSCGGRAAALLEKRLEELNGEISRLREQQHFIIRLLKNGRVPNEMNLIKVETWIALLQSMGFGEDARHKWHSEFERKYPLEHQQFLEALGMDPDEIARLREFSAAKKER